MCISDFFGTIQTIWILDGYLSNNKDANASSLL
jgi:hypothetical protein